MRSHRTALLIAAVAALLVPATAMEASAAPASRISRVQYNSPGSDTGTNYSLNAEWVQIHNYGTTARALTGWTLRDLQGHVYKFPTFTLRPGSSVRVHTGSATNTRYDLYWHSRAYIWNNTGDKAIVRNSAGSTIDTCAWGNGSGAINC